MTLNTTNNPVLALRNQPKRALTEVMFETLLYCTKLCKNILGVKEYDRRAPVINTFALPFGNFNLL